MLLYHPIDTRPKKHYSLGKTTEENTMKTLITYLLSLFFSIAYVYADSDVVPLDVMTNALRQVNLLQQEKENLTTSQKKLDSHVLHAKQLQQKQENALLKYIPWLRSCALINPKDETTLVDIRAKVTQSLLETIYHQGGKIVNSFTEYNTIRAYLPLTSIETLAQREDIFFISIANEGQSYRAPTLPHVSNAHISEGVVAHNVALVRKKYAVDGTGVKVGVLSDSTRYVADSIDQGELSNVTVLQNPASVPESLGEGTAMLEIIHDVAPGAELYFATAFGGEANFAHNIQALQAAGCTILVDDYSYPTESPFQDGIIAQAIQKVVAAGALYFSAAGNSGSQTQGNAGVWEGNFNPLKIISPFGYLHDFGQGIMLNRITKDVFNPISLHWADPLGKAKNDYDLCLFDTRGNVDTCSMNVQGGQYSNPYEIVKPTPGKPIPKGYYLAIYKKATSENRFLHLDTDGGGLQFSTDGAIRHHAISPFALAVGQVNAKSRSIPFDLHDTILKGSSDGPRRVFFQPNGTAITADDFLATGGTLRKKPDIAAASCVTTSVPKFSPFCGTSAAAPHAAGIAALLLAKKPSLTPQQVRDALTKTALDIEFPGWDRNSGYGIVMADKAMNYVENLTQEIAQ